MRCGFWRSFDASACTLFTSLSIGSLNECFRHRKRQLRSHNNNNIINTHVYSFLVLSLPVRVWRHTSMSVMCARAPLCMCMCVPYVCVCVYSRERQCDIATHVCSILRLNIFFILFFPLHISFSHRYVICQWETHAVPCCAVQYDSPSLLHVQSYTQTHSHTTTTYTTTTDTQSMRTATVSQRPSDGVNETIVDDRRQKHTMSKSNRKV